MRNADGTNLSSSSSSSSPAPLECDAWLCPKPTESFPCDGGAYYGLSLCHQAADNSVVLPTTFHNSEEDGVMGVSGKALFTASQREELERQKMMQRYIMSSSAAVPPQLLTMPNSIAPVSQSNNTSGLDLRYAGSGSDPEPWRCKRTDGKKWRCSRDVAPEQKYCERHAHKGKPRSRKHVEVSSHIRHSQPLQSSILQSDQTRGIEWFTRGITTTTTSNRRTVAARNPPWQQVAMQTTSSTLELNADIATGDQIQNVSSSAYLNAFIALNPYNIPDDTAPTFENDQPWTSILDPITGKKISPSSSLTVSTNSTDGNSDNVGQLPMDSDREIDGVSRIPGGPLGEALCLGNAKATRSCSYSASPHQRRC